MNRKLCIVALVTFRSLSCGMWHDTPDYVVLSVLQIPLKTMPSDVCRFWENFLSYNIFHLGPFSPWTHHLLEEKRSVINCVIRCWLRNISMNMCVCLHICSYNYASIYTILNLHTDTVPVTYDTKHINSLIPTLFTSVWLDHATLHVLSM